MAPGTQYQNNGGKLTTLRITEFLVGDFKPTSPLCDGIKGWAQCWSVTTATCREVYSQQRHLIFLECEVAAGTTPECRFGFVDFQEVDDVVLVKINSCTWRGLLGQSQR